MKIKNIEFAKNIMKTLDGRSLTYTKNNETVTIKNEADTTDRFGQTEKNASYNNKIQSQTQVAWELYYDRKYFHKGFSLT